MIPCKPTVIPQAPVAHRPASYILFAPALLIVLAWALEYSGLDLWWESLFYDQHKQAWPFRQHWLFDTLLHSGGQLFDKVLAVVIVILFVVINMHKSLARYRKIFFYFLIATLAGPALVGVGKALTHIYSPWDLQLFNGVFPYIRLFDPVPPGSPVGHAFPAGHASGGYCFLSLYFVFLRYRSSYRFHSLIFSVVLGLVFGLAQQIRGAHFPSHDLFTIIVCWYVSLALYLFFYPEERKHLGLHSVSIANEYANSANGGAMASRSYAEEFKTEALR